MYGKIFTFVVSKDRLETVNRVGKIHRARVTEADLHYEDSISIDHKLIEAAGFLINERVDIYNIDTGARFSTYVIGACTGDSGAPVFENQNGASVIVGVVSRSTGPNNSPVVAASPALRL